MKVLKTVNWFYHGNRYQKETAIVLVEEDTADTKVFKAWMDKRNGHGYCNLQTSNWTTSTFYSIPNRMIHSFLVKTLTPIEL